MRVTGCLLYQAYKKFDIVKVSFPFVEKAQSKVRPAVIVSSPYPFNEQTKTSIMAMITSSMKQSWPYDLEIKNLGCTGLSKRSIIRMKLFTLDQTLILQRLGHLSEVDQENFLKNLHRLFDIQNIANQTFQK